MKNLYCIIFVLIFCIAFLSSSAQEAQGTTVIKDSCNVRIILQIGLESDSVADVARMQGILNQCFALTCDLPCVDGKTGHCSIISSVVVVNWKNIKGSDKHKYHHVTMLSGVGVSSVDSIVMPNSGKSSSGKWYRKEYSDKVYCHEAMHLCGHDDHYRDCRADRLALKVDNCKDGDTCTAAQKARGECPPCKGYEDDVMGNDVTKSFDCNRDMVEILRFLNNPNFVCSDECCQKEEPKEHFIHYDYPKIGLFVDGGLGYYHMQNETMKDDKLDLLGHSFGFGVYGEFSLCQHFDMDSYFGFDCESMSDTRTSTNGMVTLDEHYTYRLDHLSVGTNFNYKYSGTTKFYAGPELGMIIAGSSRMNGTSTYNGMSTPYGSSEFNKISSKKNIQLGLNLGAEKQFQLGHFELTPYVNFHIPITNEYNFGNTKNKLSRLNIGAMFPMLNLGKR